MEEHDCPHQETIGKVKEFMESVKGFKATLATVSIAIVIQVATFLFLWGGLTTTVKANGEYLWKEISPRTTENTRNIDKILTKLEIMFDKRGIN